MVATLAVLAAADDDSAPAFMPFVIAGCFVAAVVMLVAAFRPPSTSWQTGDGRYKKGDYPEPSDSVAGLNVATFLLLAVFFAGCGFAALALAY